MTNFANQRTETDKTDETYKIRTNHEFLFGIFGDGLADTKPVLVSLIKNPNGAHKREWYGRPWNPSASEPLHSCNNYFSLSRYYPDDKGQYRRKKEQFSALYAVMLDDVGTKVPMERMTLPPSWLIETSEGNHQAGYILETPLPDPDLATRLVNAIIEAGLCDRGANGPTARLARLPFGINGKTDPAFVCQLKEWNPALRYSVKDLVHKLELDMFKKKRTPAQSKSAAKSNDHDEIFVARPTENPVIAALKSRNLYKAPLGGNKHDIICPWVHEHTGQVDGGTAYFEPDDLYPIGGFKCLHGHCAEQHVRDLLDFLSIEIMAARMKPTIRCIAGEIHRIADKAEQELAHLGRFYQRGGLIATVSTDQNTKDTCVKELSQPALLSALSSAALWERLDGRTESWVRIDPPSRVVSVLFDATDYHHLAPLNGLAHQPYLRADGTLAVQAGYDAPTGMFGVFDAKEFHVPEKPTQEESQAALDCILELLAEFSFAKDTDKAAALCAILTAAIRPSLPFAPMFHVRAPQISSGKSFLCQIITAFATPRRGAPTSFPQDDEEMRKLLLAELLRAPAIIEFDNLTSDLIAHKSLCTALTSEFLTGRILGISKMATVSTRTLFLSSGNNVAPVQDMTRRCLTINLDPRCETPAAREFKNPNVLSDLQRARGKYVSAALTLIRGWIVAGRPKTPCKAIASFEEWSDLCRQPLLWLGQSDPIEAIFEAMNEDPDRETLGRLLQAWKYNFGSTPRMVRDAVNRATEASYGSSNNELFEVLTDIGSDRQGINRRIVGHWIKRHAAQVVDGMRFVPDKGSRSAAAWRVETVSDVSV